MPLRSPETQDPIVLGLIIGMYIKHNHIFFLLNGPRQANLVLIAYASSEGSGEPAHPRSLARTFAARLQAVSQEEPQTESQIPGLFEWLGMSD